MQKMKTIGLIGGMSWRSTIEYYRIINEHVSKTLGKSHSAKIVMYSVDFEDIEHFQHEGKWSELDGIMVNAARVLEKAGAELILICTNTMHKMADLVESSIKVPFLHIVDAVADEIRRKGIKKVGLLGTKYTMEQDFYRNKLVSCGLEVVIPEPADRDRLQHIIYKEIIPGKVQKTSRQDCIDIIDRIAGRGAEGVILGCTELPLLITQEHSAVPVFDTTGIHALAAAKSALQER